MKHSEFLVGANIQQLVAKYGAAITSRIKVHPYPTRLIGSYSLQNRLALLPSQGLRVSLARTQNQLGTNPVPMKQVITNGLQPRIPNAQRKRVSK